MTVRELAFMCADTGAVVHIAPSAGTACVTVFLPTGETLWGETSLPRVDSGRSEVRMSATTSLFTAPAHIVRDEPLTPGPGPGVRQVPVSLAATVEPAGVPVTLAGPVPREVGVVQVAGSLGVGSVIYRISGSGWVGTEPAGAAGDSFECRARAAFQDRSAVYLVGGAEAAAALMRHTEIRRAPVDEFGWDGPDGGPAHRLRCAVGGRSPSVVSGELRDTEQYLTVASPAPGGDGWRWWSATPFVFVRAGVTGLGLVERGLRSASAHPSPPADDLPDPY